MPTFMSGSQYMLSLGNPMLLQNLVADSGVPATPPLPYMAALAGMLASCWWICACSRARWRALLADKGEQEA